MTRDFDNGYPTRRFVLGALLSATASAAWADGGAPRRSIRPRPRLGDTVPPKAAGTGSTAREIVRAAGLSGTTGFLVADAESGEILDGHGETRLYPPASVTKTITTLYGLETLGNGFRFRTRVMATGPIIGGRLMGDLYLVGGGDPTLDSDALGDLVRQLKQAGLREIAGNAHVHAAALPYQRAIDPGQPEYLGYNPALSGLNLNFNRVFFEWKRRKGRYDITMDARALKYRPRVSTAAMTVVDRRSPIFTLTTLERSDRWTVARRALGRKGGRWLPVRRPEFYAAEVFRTLARSFGIQLPAFRHATTLPRDARPIASWESEPLDEMLRYMLKYSTNLTAECVGLTATRKRGENPRTLRQSARVMTLWLHRTTGAGRARFVDHSGLEENNRLSAHDMVQVLLKQGWDGQLHRLMKDIPFHDARGRPIRDYPVKVNAKTGTLNFVSALAGYSAGPGSRKLAFAVFSADMNRRASIPRAERERPRGARQWNRQAKKMQQKLIESWIAQFRA